MARESSARNVGVTLPPLSDWDFFFVYFWRPSSNVNPKRDHLQTQPYSRDSRKHKALCNDPYVMCIGHLQGVFLGSRNAPYVR